MALSLKMQVFFVDRFYHYLKEEFPEQAMDALQVAFQRYVTLRGNRGAQRAVRDKRPLNFENYQRYREVVSTPEMRRMDGVSRNEHYLTDEVWVGCTYECPSGHGALREFGSPEELEQFFCKHVDRYNVLGFNPDIHYEAVTTLCDSDCCIHRAERPCVSPGAELGKRADDAPPFPFILASEYYVMKEVIEAIFGEKGEEISANVQRDFVKTYSEEDWQQLTPYANANFDIYYPKCLKN